MHIRDSRTTGGETERCNGCISVRICLLVLFVLEMMRDD